MQTNKQSNNCILAERSEKSHIIYRTRLGPLSKHQRCLSALVIAVAIDSEIKRQLQYDNYNQKRTGILISQKYRNSGIYNENEKVIQQASLSK